MRKSFRTLRLAGTREMQCPLCLSKTDEVMLLREKGGSRSQYDLSPFENIQREMERMLDDAGQWRRLAGCSWERLWRPRCNVYECKDHITVLVDLAGVQKEDLDVRADIRTLYLRGEREAPIPEAAERCHHLEIPAGVFEREISLPAAIDPARVTVSYEDGWLEIHLPKAERMRVEIEGE